MVAPKPANRSLNCTAKIAECVCADGHVRSLSSVSRPARRFGVPWLQDFAQREKPFFNGHALPRENRPYLVVPIEPHWIVVAEFMYPHDCMLDGVRVLDEIRMFSNGGDKLWAAPNLVKKRLRCRAHGHFCTTTRRAHGRPSRLYASMKVTRGPLDLESRFLGDSLICRKRSGLPSSRTMKPKPFWLSNHLIFPTCLVAVSLVLHGRPIKRWARIL